mgnify:CR=1 FL=1
MNAIETVVQRAHRNEKAAKTFITICGIGMALVPLLIGAFLFIKGTDTFFTFGHSVTEFLFSGGQVGAAMFLAGSLVTCLLSLIISLPFSLASSIYMTEIATPQRRRLIQPAIELFTGIPSVVYGFVGMTVLIPALRHIFPMPFGFSVLAAGIVLAIMIFPTITTMAADAMAAVPKSWPGPGPCHGRSRGCCHGHRPDESLPDVPVPAGQYADDGYFGRYGRRHGRRRIQRRSVDDGPGPVPAVVPVHLYHSSDQCRFRIKRRTELI